jgi:hypothetical protein
VPGNKRFRQFVHAGLDGLAGFAVQRDLTVGQAEPAAQLIVGPDDAIRRVSAAVQRALVERRSDRLDVCVVLAAEVSADEL